MKNKVQTVTIGIPAYNEEKNIQVVLKDILRQKQENFKLEHVIVLCDGCTDRTEEKAKQIKDKRIVIVNDKKRLGKTTRLQQLFQRNTSDIIVMFDSDIQLNNNIVIEKLIQPFLNDTQIKLVGGNSMPFAPKTFFEKAVYTTFHVFYKSRSLLKNGENIFGCTGSILAIEKAFAKSVSFPKIVNEDAYLYLLCISKKYKFYYVNDAIVRYNLPKTVNDYIKQIFRSDPISVSSELETYFGSLARNEFKRPTFFYLKAIIEVFFKNPFGLIYIVLVNLLCRPFLPFILKNYRLDWFTATSTKTKI